MLEVDLIADYLVENSYASTTSNAYELIQCMSDSFLFSIVENIESDTLIEMRREDKERVKRGELRVPKWTANPKKRTEIMTIPASISGTGSRRHVIKRSEVPNLNTPDNLFIAMKRRAQGMPGIPGDTRYSRATDTTHLVSPHTAIRHPHGGGEPGVPAGRSRGKSRRKSRAEEESRNVRRPNADTSKGPSVTRPGPSSSTTSVGRIRKRLKARDLQRKMRETNLSTDPNMTGFADATPKDLINRVPKLNLPKPGGRKVNPKTARNKLGAARTGSQVLSALEKLSKK